MKDDSAPQGLTLSQFDDELAALIDMADDSLSIAELLGALELQVFVLKMRATGQWKDPTK